MAFVNGVLTGVFTVVAVESVVLLFLFFKLYRHVKRTHDRMQDEVRLRKAADRATREQQNVP